MSNTVHIKRNGLGYELVAAGKLSGNVENEMVGLVFASVYCNEAVLNLLGVVAQTYRRLAYFVFDSSQFK